MVSEKPQATDSLVATIHHLNPERVIAGLQKEVERLTLQNIRLRRSQERRRQERTRIVAQNNDRGVAVRVLAQLLIAESDENRWYTGLHGRTVNDRTAFEHWRRNGGSESFRAAAKTPEEAIRLVREHFSGQSKNRV